MCNKPVNVRLPIKSLKPDDSQVWQTVACRSCPDCLAARQINWYVRMAYELALGTNRAYFITLTYNDWEVTKTDSGLTLVPNDLTNYQKRLNVNTTRAGYETGRYYSVGEYGGQTKRPHYHQILFSDVPHTYLMEDLVYKSWQGRGHITVYRAKPEALMYVAGYAQKRLKHRYVFKEDAKRDKRVPEFNRMSLGIGKDYLTESKILWHRENDNLEIIDPYNLGTFKFLPEYYRRRIWTTESEKARLSEILSNRMRDPEYVSIDDRLKRARIKQQYNKFRLNYQTLPDTIRIAI